MMGFWKGFVSAMLVVLFACLLFSDGEPPIFKLIFNGFEERPIESVLVETGGSTIELHRPQFHLYLGKERPILELLMHQQEGALNLRIVTQSGESFSLENIEFRVGEANYITRQDQKIIAVKAHWQ
ncbi:hypothetical protein [Agarivorans litoreus]|uniref:hypothetical protein n=1 Tax=Agarivorans litoreus TaxID=1510455 RepID=UPI001C7D5DA9|nr:hypothetical protein [Agarivorans litoreus]